MAKSHYWFPAKRYGWGRGAPDAWQAWVVLLGSVALLTACAFVLPPGVNPFCFIACTFVLCVAMLAHRSCRTLDTDNSHRTYATQ